MYFGSVSTRTTMRIPLYVSINICPRMSSSADIHTFAYIHTCRSDLNIVNKFGNTALLAAIEQEHLETANMLVDEGAEKYHINMKVRGVLWCAVA